MAAAADAAGAHNCAADAVADAGGGDDAGGGYEEDGNRLQEEEPKERDGGDRPLGDERKHKKRETPSWAAWRALVAANRQRQQTRKTKCDEPRSSHEMAGVPTHRCPRAGAPAPIAARIPPRCRQRRRHCWNCCCGWESPTLPGCRRGPSKLRRRWMVGQEEESVSTDERGGLLAWPADDVAILPRTSRAGGRADHLWEN